MVLDVQMPGMGGLNLQKHLESIGRQIPIVFVTGFAEDAAKAEALAAGATCFLAKPFRERELVDGIRSALHWEN